ncbi:protein phosphatase 2C Ptc4 [Schizosaccharomyces japonicus yFS275]|uniref:Protein phosphatase 2C Ptc4 n=1 Tax=Schizosaccharomyces japonicus (strain yFS275 / FY16936) TaxID=402676 RepID=B6K2G4_SCHJY|nr:protein phosphatase 2C Ptc4 [Schizosaccharomyces japonicus yFS275]EEB07345.1 protein phosphatase 2C Ptc4 [Schizosaccharomyces japonicus yFS275]
MSMFKTISRAFRFQSRRSYQTYYTPKYGRFLRIPMDHVPQSLGIATARGDNPCNEDRLAYGYMNGIKQCNGEHDSPFFYGVFDGHGGSECSQYLAENLGRILEENNFANAKAILHEAKSIGGYAEKLKSPFPLSLLPYLRTESRVWQAKLYYSFLDADLRYLRANMSPDSEKAIPGSVGTVAVITTQTSKPYWDSDAYHIHLAHVGDTRAILCDARTGRAHRLTFQHNLSNHGEANRLQKYSVNFCMDSFGQRRFAYVANTRSFGEGYKLKRLGVSCEPQLTSLSCLRDDWAFLILVTDGITDVITDAELTDIVKLSSNPQDAAQNVLRYAQSIGSVDDLSCLVISLPGWGRRTINDFTNDLRDTKSSAPIRPQ